MTAVINFMGSKISLSPALFALLSAFICVVIVHGVEVVGGHTPTAWINNTGTDLMWALFSMCGLHGGLNIVQTKRNGTKPAEVAVPVTRPDYSA
jgi:hypothetical protein